MIPSLIKFISIDDLTRYEPHDGQRREYRRRIGIIPLRFAASLEENQLPAALRTWQRVYRFEERVFDNEKGTLIEIYREQP